MEKNKIYGYVGMGAGLLMIISLFLPFVSAFGMSQSLWKVNEGSRVLFLLLGIFVIALYVFNKKTELGYLAAGFGVFHLIAMVIQADGLDYFGVGFYFLFIASLAIGVVTYLYDESKGTALVNLSVNGPISISIAKPTNSAKPSEPTKTKKDENNN